MATLSRPARLKTRVEGGRPSRPRVHCGWRDCGTLVAWVKGDPFTIDQVAMHPHEHEVRWEPGFRRGKDGVVRLIRHAARLWRRAQRDGVSWNQFVDRGGLRQRRAYIPRQQRPGALPDSREPGGSLDPDGKIGWLEREFVFYDRYEVTTGLTTFICPVCNKASILDVPDAPHFFARCSTCQPELPLVDGDYVDGDYVIEFPA